ncbi:hypothetical protein O6H91_02G024500 [Diphasiastrum complanatum]|uniref:Uncharacterized protein n=3 Tax=Diphasiastrum complanatum TaxID=34168 RepID=A0ACC2EDN4_DIPCM|nr:hypothetical protein O6H91_02G024500 [Diphasiastrum complanatum]KAJ7564588.1 hypothetical protein O6H91_02G024500 [Diphasiastrum complanatum]KAJ7564589.1 hypothetical protein O6H91_02G024500 [Diphasiastrum complanatum]
MDRRSWPWKKKSRDKMAVIPISADSSPARSCLGQSTPKSPKAQLQISNEPKVELQSFEECKHISERLSAALDDASAKELLIQQHKKLAEDAVSGWEKAQAEATALRGLIDESAAQKIDFLKEIAQLGAAVKDLKRELHKVKEEQEQKIQYAIQENETAWDTVRKVFEAKLSKASHQLLKAEAEKNSTLKSLQEATKAASELHHTNSVAEAEAKGLRAKVEALAMENSALRLEIEGMSKELDFCNEERACGRREIDAVNKRHLDCVRRMEKLESECQKLRVSLRQKVASAIQPAYWRLELDAQKKDSAEGKKRYSITNAVLQRAEANEISLPSTPRGPRPGPDFDRSDRLSAMEEEAKMLKEALTKRNGELQAARLMCARTAGKLSQVEEHLDVVQGLQKTNVKSPLAMHSSPSLASLPDRSSNEVYSAEAWAAALVAELAQFKKERIAFMSDSFSDMSNFDLMDDFVEMEQLALRMPASKESIHENAIQQSNEAIGSLKNGMAVQNKSTGTEEMPESKQAYMELTRKLGLAAEKISALQLKNISSEAAVVYLQQKLDAAQAKAQSEGTSMDKLFDKATTTVATPDNRTSEVAALCNLPLNCNDKSVSISLIVKLQNENQFTSTVFKILDSVEVLAHISARQANSSPVYADAKTETPGEGNTVKQQQQDQKGVIHSDKFDLAVHSKRLVSISYGILQEKADISEFVMELAFILESVVAMASPPVDMSSLRPNGKISSLSEAPCKAEDMEEETKDMLVPFVFPSKEASFAHSKDLENGTSTFYLSIRPESLNENPCLQPKNDRAMDMADQKIKQMRGQISIAERLVQLLPEQKLEQLTENRQAAMAFWKKEYNSETEAAEDIELNRLNKRLEALQSGSKNVHKEHHGIDESNELQSL